MALSKVDLANQVENQLPQNLVANNLPFRNIIINGDMSIAQRGTSETGITGSGYNTVDRFGSTIATAGTWTQSQSTDVPTGQGFATSLKYDCTTANASLSASSQIRIQQAIEGQNLQYLKYGTANAQSTTLSFWVKSNKIGTYIIQLLNGAVSRQVGKPYTINTADTWEKKTITFPEDTSSSLNNNNSVGLYVMFCLGTGTDRSSGTLQETWSSFVSANQFAGQTVNLADSTSNYINITGVQLEAGTTASDFEFLPVDVNLQRCLRYYNEINEANNSTTFIAGAHDGTNGTAICPYMFPVSMRAAPTVSYTGTFNCYVASAGTNKSDLGIQTGTRGLRTLASSVTGANGYAVHIDFAAGAKIHLSAEL